MYVEINAAGCPNICRHCGVDGCFPYGEFFSLSELRTIKDEWGGLIIRYEPTAHPNFPEIYNTDIATAHGGWLVTNGFGLARRDDYLFMFERMRAMSITTIAFTLHGLQEHHDWFVCRQGAFDDILLATRRAKEFGFSINWQIYVDKLGIDDIPELIDLTLKEIGELPSLEIPYNRVGGRLWHYEKIRLTLSDVEKHRLHKLIDDPEKNSLIKPEHLTSSTWLKKWLNSPDSDEFKHPYEPPSWFPEISYPTLCIRIDRNRKTYLDPMCNSPIYLGKISDGKSAIIERLRKLQMPLHCDLMPNEVNLSLEEQEQLHPIGFSLRYKEISKKRFGNITACR
ncbi:MAG: radical SAM protein [Chloroflexi bacterium]|nr:radical SAM protein [Chloroflexota bacterium]